MYLVDVSGDKVSGVKYAVDQTNNELVAHNVSKETPLYFALPKGFLGKKASTRDLLLSNTYEKFIG